jgi:hypothetical protein
MMVCPQCQQQNRAGFLFCAACGTDLASPVRDGAAVGGAVGGAAGVLDVDVAVDVVVAVCVQLAPKTALPLRVRVREAGLAARVIAALTARGYVVSDDAPSGVDLDPPRAEGVDFIVRGAPVSPHSPLREYAYRVRFIDDAWRVVETRTLIVV